jgi:hypothetical protein
MADFPNIPFSIDKTMDLTAGASLPAGCVLGRRYIEPETGRIFILWKIDPALTRDTFATGETASLKASHTVTNDVSDALDATSPHFAGVALGSLAESTSGTTDRYGLFLVNGRCTVTITDGSADAGDMLMLNTSVDGGCIEFDETSTALAGNIATSKFVGVAFAADSGNSCDVYVKSVLFG